MYKEKKKHTFTSCLVTRKIISPTLGKRLAYTKLRWNLLLDNIKAITRRNPFRVIKATSFALKFL